MNKQFKLTSLTLAISLAISAQVNANNQHSQDAVNQKCDDECTAQKDVGRISTNNDFQDKVVSENVERHLVKKSFVFHGISDAKKEELADEKMTTGGFSIQKQTTIHFDSGKHLITESTLQEIKNVIKELEGKKQLKLHFVGHADSQQLSQNAKNIYQSNQGLSEFRANIIAQYFKKALILSDDAISTEGKSNNIPLVNTDTFFGMAKNRRVELVATYVDVEKIFLPNQICSGELDLAKGMRITVDGKLMDATQTIDNADEQRCADIALEKIDIQLQYDNLKNEPQLNINHALVSLNDDLILNLQGYSNYVYFFDKSEVLIYHSKSQKPIQTISLNESMSGSWKIPSEWKENDAFNKNELSYRLRVYDKNGKFDETLQQPIAYFDLLNKEDETYQSDLTEALLSGYGGSKLTKQNITVNGGSLTLNGKNTPLNHHVYFLGRELNISQDRRFVVQQILPEGIQRAEVAVIDDSGNGQLIYRDLELKQNDWFYVALADITLGKNSTNGPIQLLTGDNQHFDGDIFVDGRLAFYAKGKMGGGYKVTASVDTREEPLGEIFSNLSAKDPHSLFRRLDDENHYAVYGDDSTLKEDAPTKGKFYLKVEDNQSHMMWGNFKTKFDQTDLTRIERGLYGAQLDWNSEDVTSFGEKKTQIDFFAAEADTRSVYEQHQGTGGSLYYLQHQDITQGSERLAIEIRDKDSDLVISRTSLIAGSDYNVDSLQGRILLNKPLASTSHDGLLIRDAGISGHPAYLVVNYEYTPGFEELDNLTLGGRVSHWLNDKVKLGVTASNQDLGIEDQKLLGFDLLYRNSEDSYVKAESASSDGLALDAQSSNNGGYHFDSIESSNTAIKANAHRIESGFSFTDLGFEAQGKGQFYWQQKEAGYNGLGQLTRYDTQQIGANLKWTVTEDSDIRLKLDNRDEDGGIDKQSAEIDFVHALNNNWAVSVGLRTDETTPTAMPPIATQNQNTGLRSNLAVQLDYQQETDWSAFVFAQATLEHAANRTANDRIGFGGRYQVNDKVGVSAEVSEGNLGFGSQVGADYQYSDGSNVYLNYELDPDKTDNGIAGKNGQLVTGTRHRFSDSTSVYAEERYLHGDGQTGLTHAYGVEYSPTERWTFGLALENGQIQQPNLDSLNRNSISLNAGYATTDFKYASALEYREDKTTAETRESWLVRNNFSYQVSPNWRTQLRVDLAISDSSNGNALNSDFTEALLGFAYRPVENDKLNALFTYNFLEDLAPSEQFTGSGVQNDYQQRSHVFAVDANYDLTARWTVGGKIARRQGEIKQGRDSGVWFDSTTDLYIVRADWHIVKNWDFLIEGRLLDVSGSQDSRSGALVALHRHFGEHVKLGVGYNFTDFSDDLTNLDYNAKGWFVNLVGKL
jgi:outer membrane protein OmpA-like peptidoglycan-associated protein